MLQVAVMPNKSSSRSPWSSSVYLLTVDIVASMSYWPLGNYRSAGTFHTVYKTTCMLHSIVHGILCYVKIRHPNKNKYIEVLLVFVTFTRLSFF